MECVRNINTVVDLLGGKVEEFKESSGLKNVEAEDVMRIIASTSMDEVHLFDFAALDDVRLVFLLLLFWRPLFNLFNPRLAADDLA